MFLVAATNKVFLYPPSEDSLIQVTPSNFKSCNTKDPILYMNDGNSLFNLTQNGTLYFTSANPGHCTKYQKLLVSVGTYSAEAEALSPSSAADAPSYQNAFGSIPLSQKSSASSSLISAFSTVAASLACAVVGAIMWWNFWISLFIKANSHCFFFVLFLLSSLNYLFFFIGSYLFISRKWICQFSKLLTDMYTQWHNPYSSKFWISVKYISFFQSVIPDAMHIFTCNQKLREMK